jgi:tetratricopeptide (TPR) repeat protein
MNIDKDCIIKSPPIYIKVIEHHFNKGYYDKDDLIKYVNILLNDIELNDKLKSIPLCLKICESLNDKYKFDNLEQNPIITYCKKIILLCDTNQQIQCEKLTAIILLTDVYIKEYNYTDILKYLLMYYKIDSTNINIKLKLVNYYQYNDDFDTSYEYIQSILDVDKDNIEAHLLRIEYYIIKSISYWSKAEENLNNIIDKNPNHIEANCKYALFLINKRKNKEKSEQIINKMVSLYPNNNEVKLTKFKIETSLYKSIKSIKTNYDELISLYKDVKNKCYIYSSYIRVLIFQNKLDEAYVILIKAKKLLNGSYHFNIYYHMGIYYEKTNNIDSALKYYFEILKYNKCNYKINKSCGFLLLKQEKYREAISFFKQGLFLVSQSNEIYHYLGICYSCTNQTALATKTFEQGLKFDPNHFKTKLEYSKHLCFISKNKTDNSNGLKMFENLLSITTLENRYKIKINGYLAKYYEQKLQINKAISYFKKVIEEIGTSVFNKKDIDLINKYYLDLQKKEKIINKDNITKKLDNLKKELDNAKMIQEKQKFEQIDLDIRKKNISDLIERTNSNILKESKQLQQYIITDVTDLTSDNSTYESPQKKSKLN